MDNEMLIALLETQISHIDTLDRILGNIKDTLRLSNIAYDHGDYDEMLVINNELIEFIDNVLVEELN